ncbi:hypothetical protein ACRAWC_24340 [Leifsonia sp. L25]|uniref:hypothetical protein n=1 Tax=Leifsonia sp. L25 TaxID=3423957 RepID=UPI003D692873
MPADGLLDALAESDLVAHLLRGHRLRAHPSAPRRGARAAPVRPRRRLVIDLGLPRNVDPAVAEFAGVELLDLETISIHAPLEELHAADDARSIVDAAAAEYRARSAEQAVTPALVALRKHVFDVLDAEIERARGRGDASDQTEAALRHLAGVLLHTPSVRARELARQGEAQSFIDGAAALFGVDIEAEAAGRPHLSAVDDASAAS